KREKRRRRAPGGFTRRSARSEDGERAGGSNSVVESQPSKLLVAGSIPVSRSNLRSLRELRLASQRALSRRLSTVARSAKVDRLASQRALSRRLSTVARSAKVDRLASQRALSRRLSTVARSAKVDPLMNATRASLSNATWKREGRLSGRSAT